jgi:hypothetical protein
MLERNTNENIYIAGRTTKDVAAGLTSSYFPLDNGGGIPYFSSAWAGGLSDNFIASICNESPTGVLDAEGITSSAPVALYSANGTLLISGLTGASNSLQLFDATGRLLFDYPSMPTIGGTVQLETDDLASGIYIIGTNQGALKILVP